MWQCWATPLLFLLVISLISFKLIHSSLNLAQAYSICMHQNLLYIPFTAHLFTYFFPHKISSVGSEQPFSLPDLWLGWHCVFVTLIFILLRSMTANPTTINPLTSFNTLSAIFYILRKREGKKKKKKDLKHAFAKQWFCVFGWLPQHYSRPN